MIVVEEKYSIRLALESVMTPCETIRRLRRKTLRIYVYGIRVQGFYTCIHRVPYLLRNKISELLIDIDITQFRFKLRSISYYPHACDEEFAMCDYTEKDLQSLKREARTIYYTI